MKNFTKSRKRGLIILLVLLFGHVVSSHAQTDRFGWLDALTTTDLIQFSKDQIRTAFDTIDLQSLSAAEVDYVDHIFGSLERKWAEAHNEDRIPKGYPASTVFVGGMQSKECVEIATREILLVPGVVSIMHVDLSEQSIAFYYDQAFQGRVETQIIPLIKEKLSNIGFQVLTIYETALPENQSLVKSLKGSVIDEQPSSGH